MLLDAGREPVRVKFISNLAFFHGVELLISNRLQLLLNDILQGLDY